MLYDLIIEDETADADFCNISELLRYQYYVYYTYSEIVIECDESKLKEIKYCLMEYILNAKYFFIKPKIYKKTRPKTGFTQSIETKNKISKSMTGHKTSNMTKAKMRLARLEYWANIRHLSHDSD